jgi:hypothetical protein
VQSRRQKLRRIGIHCRNLRLKLTLPKPPASGGQVQQGLSAAMHHCAFDFSSPRRQINAIR